MILPDLAELVSLRGAAHGLSLHAHRPALARLQGAHRSAQRGRGLEFEEVRLYASGDDARNIDWRVTARRGQPHTKLFREERERPIWIIADLHAGLFFGSRYQLKSALLLRTAALLAWVAILGGDRLGAIITHGRELPAVFPPRTREASVLPVLEALIESQPQAPGPIDTQSLQMALDAALPVIKPGSLVLILSDFSGLNEEVETRLTGLAMHNDCRLLWLVDPLEYNGLPPGNYRIGLPERLWWLDGLRSRPAWQEKWSLQAQRLEDISMRLSVPLTRMDTQYPVSETLPPLLRESAWPT